MRILIKIVISSVLILFVGVWLLVCLDITKAITAQNKHIDRQGNEIIIHKGDGYKFCFFERKVEILTEDNINIKEESEPEFVHRVMQFVKKQKVFDLTFTQTRAVVKIEVYVVTLRYPDVDWIFDSKGKILKAFIRWHTSIKRFPKEIEKNKLK